MNEPTASPKPFAVYDYRTDVRNVVVMPELRGRFLRMEPGEVGPFHGHDIGQEVFIVLEGRCEFLIDGHRETLGPGQMCVALTDQPHEVRVVGDEPMTMYLSVTPHLEPTHTFWDDAGRPLPPAYGFWSPAGLADFPTPSEPAAGLAERFTAAVAALETSLLEATDARGNLVGALTTDDPSHAEADKAAVDALWPLMRDHAQRWTAVMAAWNDLAFAVGQAAPADGAALAPAGDDEAVPGATGAGDAAPGDASAPNAGRPQPEEHR